MCWFLWWRGGILWSRKVRLPTWFKCKVISKIQRKCFLFLEYQGNVIDNISPSTQQKNLYTSLAISWLLKTKAYSTVSATSFWVHWLVIFLLDLSHSYIFWAIIVGRYHHVTACFSYDAIIINPTKCIKRRKTIIKLHYYGG